MRSFFGSSPFAAKDGLSSSGSGFAPAWGSTLNAAVGTAQRGVAFLAAKAPRPPPAMGGVDLPALRRPWTPTGQELSAFARRLEAVKDPTFVLDAMAAGTVTREHLEALREVYPELHAELRGKVLERVASCTAPSPTSSAWRWASFSGSRGTAAPPPAAVAFYQG